MNRVQEGRLRKNKARFVGFLLCDAFSYLRPHDILEYRGLRYG